MIRQPMLAAKSSDADLRQIKYPVLVSPKIDGIRATVIDGQLTSRSMKPIRNEVTQRLFGRREFEGLDGELVVGNPTDPNLMQQTTSGVMKIKGDPKAKFYIFDRWNVYAGFDLRYDSISRAQFNHPDIVVLEHFIVDSYEELLETEQKFLALGYEGLMIRSLKGSYKEGRSTLREGGLIKVKRFEDAEAVVTGYGQLMRNTNEAFSDERGYTRRSTEAAGKVGDEMLGYLECCRDSSDVSFNIGSGFTEAQRSSLWAARHTLIGRVVKYKHFAVTGVKDRPRIPIFLGFRDKDDMS